MAQFVAYSLREALAVSMSQLSMLPNRVSVQRDIPTIFPNICHQQRTGYLDASLQHIVSTISRDMQMQMLSPRNAASVVASHRPSLTIDLLIHGAISPLGASASGRG